MIKELLIVWGTLFIVAFAAGADYQPVVRATQYKVVTITVHGIGKPPLSIMDVLTGKTPEERPMTFLGSGSIITSDGVILTCDHLFTDKLKGQTVTVVLANGQKLKAIILAEDKERDLATLKVFPLHKLGYFRFGGGLHKGQEVISLGSPLGIEGTVSFGHVENLSVSDKVRNRILHSATINHGNSGGPLIDIAGRLVGVNIESFVDTEAMHMAVTLKDIHYFLGE